MKHYKDRERRERIIGLKRGMNFFRVELLLLVQDTYNHLFSTIVGWV
jgi:hypothetical protein